MFKDREVVVGLEVVVRENFQEVNSSCLNHESSPPGYFSWKTQRKLAISILSRFFFMDLKETRLLKQKENLLICLKVKRKFSFRHGWIQGLK